MCIILYFGLFGVEDFFGIFCSYISNY
jgi:hypothetical protein